MARYGLNDPDTCWLLAVGRYIVDHRAMPASDHFSYTALTFGTAGEPSYVIYQGLSEVVFYLCYKCAGLVGLLAMVALFLANTFMVLPLVIAQKLKCPHVLSLGLVALSAWAIFPRFFVRPEVWSNLFIVLWLVLLGLLRLRSLRNDTDDNNAAVDWRLVAFAVGLMILWCNLHICFVVGILLLVGHLICATIESMLPGSFKTKLPLTDWLMLPLTAAASLITPWGIGLWMYLPKVFSLPINKITKEMQPLEPKDLQHPFYYPFLALALICCILMVVRIFWAEKNNKVRESIGLFAPLLTCAAVVEAIMVKRAVAYTVAIIVVQALLCWRNMQTPPKSATIQPASKKSGKKESKINRAKTMSGDPPQSFGAELEKRLDKLYGSKQLLWLGAINIVTILVVPVYCMVYPQSMPQIRPDFRPPLKALQYISQHTPPGHMFNSTLFGDVAIWYLNGNPKVFIDTRFDLYSIELANDYFAIYLCHPGWQDTMTKYAIDWVFVPPESILANKLTNDPAWQKLYGDEDAVILAHRNNH